MLRITQFIMRKSKHSKVKKEIEDPTNTSFERNKLTNPVFKILGSKPKTKPKKEWGDESGSDEEE